MRSVSKTASIYLGALAAGFVLSRIGVPLPWMVGPLLVVGSASIRGTRIMVPRGTRSLGQAIVAFSVGLNFTPAAADQVLSNAPHMLGAAAATIAVGYLTAVVLMTVGAVDSRTAFFAGMPGGPAEMANLAERYGGRGDLVALAQTLRVALIVLTIPPALYALNGHPAAPGPQPPDASLATLAAFAGLLTLGGVVFARLRITNPWFLGPLAAGCLVGFTVMTDEHVPPFLVGAAQVLLGVSLGRRFDRRLIEGSARYVTGAVVSTAFLIGSCVLVAIGLALVSSIPVGSLILSTAPGSVAEMSVVAKVMHLDVAVVTGFHIVRIFALLPLMPLLYWPARRLTQGWSQRRTTRSATAPETTTNENEGSTS